MTVAVDTNVLFDIILPDQPHGDRSEQALYDAANSGRVIISEAAYAELAGHFRSLRDFEQFLARVGVVYEPSSTETLGLAGTSWAEYARAPRRRLRCPSCGIQQEVTCDTCGASLTRRQHVLADFLIGAHAQVHAGRLLTRDRGYYARYFPDLRIV